MPIRFVVEHEAAVTRESWKGWTLCLQWGSLTDERGKITQRGYRNIWRDTANRLFTGRAQTRLPSKAISDELWAIAEKEGWANLVADELRKDPQFGPVTLVWHTGRPLGHAERGESPPRAELREFATNQAAIKYVCERMDRNKTESKGLRSHEAFIDPFIMADGDIIWNRVELQREYERCRKATDK